MGGLSYTTKMPCPSYGLPAGRSCPTGRRLRKTKGSVCSVCYGCKGRYGFTSVRDAQERRLRSTKDPRWVEAMVVLLNRECKASGLFRWHDTGDLYSQEYFEKVLAVVRSTPGILHRLPTKEWQMVCAQFRDRKLPPNLVIQLAFPMINQTGPVPRLKRGMTTAMVFTGDEGPPSGVFYCPATQPDGTHACGTCRVCWYDATQCVGYRKH